MKLSDLRSNQQERMADVLCRCGHKRHDHGPGVIVSNGEEYKREDLCHVCGGKKCDEYEADYTL